MGLNLRQYAKLTAELCVSLFDVTQGADNLFTRHGLLVLQQVSVNTPQHLHHYHNTYTTTTTLRPLPQHLDIVFCTQQSGLFYVISNTTVTNGTVFSLTRYIITTDL